MDKSTLEQKHEQFNEFFMIKHSLPVNIKRLDKSFTLPDTEQLHNHMPYVFQVASELAEIEAKALRPLRSLGEHAIELADFLNHQSRKIDLMMSLILQQQSDPQDNFSSTQFGGGGISVLTDTKIEVGEYLELKIFLREEASAIFCYAETINCEATPDGFLTSMIFSRIREEDQDLLVKASLHLQAANLRKRHKQSANEKS
jgi:hypothetical protein